MLFRQVKSQLLLLFGTSCLQKSRQMLILLVTTLASVSQIVFPTISLYIQLFFLALIALELLVFKSMQVFEHQRVYINSFVGFFIYFGAFVLLKSKIDWIGASLSNHSEFLHMAGIVFLSWYLCFAVNKFALNRLSTARVGAINLLCLISLYILIVGTILGDAMAQNNVIFRDSISNFYLMIALVTGVHFCLSISTESMANVLLRALIAIALAGVNVLLFWENFQLWSVMSNFVQICIMGVAMSVAFLIILQYGGTKHIIWMSILIAAIICGQLSIRFIHNNALSGNDWFLLIFGTIILLPPVAYYGKKSNIALYLLILTIISLLSIFFIQTQALEMMRWILLFLFLKPAVMNLLHSKRQPLINKLFVFLPLFILFCWYCTWGKMDNFTGVGIFSFSSGINGVIQMGASIISWSIALNLLPALLLYRALTSLLRAIQNVLPDGYGQKTYNSLLHNSRLLNAKICVMVLFVGSIVFGGCEIGDLRLIFLVGFALMFLEMCGYEQGQKR